MRNSERIAMQKLSRALGFTSDIYDSVTLMMNAATRISRLKDELAELRERNEKVNSIIGEAIGHLETELGEWLGIEPPYNNYPDMNEAHALLLSVYQALPEPPEDI